jgi:hypothetical protein
MDLLLSTSGIAGSWDVGGLEGGVLVRAEGGSSGWRESGGEGERKDSLTWHHRVFVGILLHSFLLFPLLVSVVRVGIP